MVLIRQVVFTCVLASCGLLEAGVVREKVVFDTDIGGDPDDGLALVYLLKEPRCDLVGITTTSGRPETSARVASALCRSLGRGDVPIHAGCSLPVHRGVNRVPSVRPASPKKAGWPEALQEWPHDKIFADGSAVEFLRRTIRANPGEVVLLATGPLTNLAVLFAVDPEIPSLLKRLVVMGGNPDGKSCEWNAMVDVFATAAVLEGGFRKSPPECLLIGADVTTPYHLPPDRGRAFLAQSPDFAFVRGHYAEQWFARPIDLYFHDPIAAVAIFHPECLAWETSAVKVDVGDQAKTVRVRPSGDSTWAWQTATAVDFEKFKAAFLSVLAFVNCLGNRT